VDDDVEAFVRRRRDEVDGELLELLIASGISR
jgi:hypothetical protein